MTQKIRAYIMRAEDGISYEGYFQLIDNALSTFQKIVGGHIETVTLPNGVKIVLNEDGKMRGLSPNRAWVDEKLNVLDIFMGNIVAVRSEGENFAGIWEEDIVEIEKFLKPMFLGMIMLGDNPDLPKVEEDEK